MSASSGCGGSHCGDRDDFGGVGDGECRQTPEGSDGEAGGGVHQPRPSGTWAGSVAVQYEAGEEFADVVCRAFLEGHLVPRDRVAREALLRCRDAVSRARRAGEGMVSVSTPSGDYFVPAAEVGGDSPDGGRLGR